MSTDMHDIAGLDTAGIRLNVDRHRVLFAALGCTSPDEIAAVTGVSARTVRRARKGVIGEVFIAQTIAALRSNRKQLRQQGLEPPTLDDLFEVVETGQRTA